MKDKTLTERLEDSGFIGSGFIWSKEYRQRFNDVTRMYGSGIALYVKFVFQGGARDMDEFQQGYTRQFVYMKKKGYINTLADPAKHKEKVKNLMVEVSDEPWFPFIWCPFMKLRAKEVVDAHGLGSDFEDALCYTLQGEHIHEFKDDEEFRQAKRTYLKNNGFLD